MEDFKSITYEEMKEWCQGTFNDWTESRLLDILTGEYDLNEARKDVLTFRKPKQE